MSSCLPCDENESWWPDPTLFVDDHDDANFTTVVGGGVASRVYDCVGFMIVCAGVLAAAWVALWVLCWTRHGSPRKGCERAWGAVQMILAFTPCVTRFRLWAERTAAPAIAWLRRQPYGVRVHSMQLAATPPSTLIAKIFPRDAHPQWAAHADGVKQWTWHLHTRVPVATAYSVAGAPCPVYYACMRGAVVLPPHPRSVYWDEDGLMITRRICAGYWYSYDVASAAWTAQMIGDDVLNHLRACFGPMQLRRDIAGPHDWSGPELNAFFALAARIAASTMRKPIGMEARHAQRHVRSLPSAPQQFLMLRGQDASELLLRL